MLPTFVTNGHQRSLRRVTIQRDDDHRNSEDDENASDQLLDDFLIYIVDHIIVCAFNYFIFYPRLFCLSNVYVETFKCAMCFRMPKAKKNSLFSMDNVDRFPQTDGRVKI